MDTLCEKYRVRFTPETLKRYLHETVESLRVKYAQDPSLCNVHETCWHGCVFGFVWMNENTGLTYDTIVDMHKHAAIQLLRENADAT